MVDNNANNSLSTEAIVGITIGGLLIIAIITLMIYFCKKTAKPKKILPEDSFRGA